MPSRKSPENRRRVHVERGHARHRRGMRHQRRQRRLGVEIQFEVQRTDRLRCFRREEGRRDRQNAAGLCDQGRQAHHRHGYVVRATEFAAADGKTPVGFDVDIAKALAEVFGLEANPETANFDSIIPAVGAKYDIGISSFTVTKERLEAVDFVATSTPAPHGP